MFQVNILDLKALKMLSHSLKLHLNVRIWWSHRILNGPQCPFLAVPPHIIGPQCLQEPGILEILDLKPFEEPAILAVTQSNQ